MAWSAQTQEEKIPRVWFSYSSFQQVRQPSILSPVEEDTSKIRDTTGTFFTQGPSIVLLEWRSIMFNGSFLRVCMILRFVKNIRFCLLESGRTKPWCPGLVLKICTNWEFLGLNNKPSTSCNWFLCFGTRPRHQTRHHGLVRPNSRRENIIFCALNNKPSTSCHWFLCFGRDTKLGHHGLVRPDSRRENLIFCTIRNFIHALK